MPAYFSAIAGAIVRLVDRGEPVDLATVQADLVATGDLAVAGGAPGLALLCERGAMSVHASSYMTIVRERAMRRELLRLGMDLTRAAAGVGAEDTASLTGRMIERLLQIETAGVDGLVAPERLADELATPAVSRSVNTSISLLDEYCDGVPAGNLVVLAGRPGMGKTAMAVQIARHVACRLRQPVLFASLEYPDSERC